MRKKEYIKKKEYLDIYLSLMALFFFGTSISYAGNCDQAGFPWSGLFQAKTCGNPPEAF